jgi:hypothetical protein
MTFKDLKKRISNNNQQQIQSLDKLQNKPFWIWNIEEHKQEDVRTKGECCFNHIIGLPTLWKSHHYIHANGYSLNASLNFCSNHCTVGIRTHESVLHVGSGIYGDGLYPI